MVIRGEKLSIEALFDSIDQEQMWRDLCPGFVGFKRKFRSPFRRDTDPSFVVRLVGGIGLYKDFGSNESGTIVHFVMRYNNLSFKEAVYYIGHKYNLCNNWGSTIAGKRPTVPSKKKESDTTRSIIEVEYRPYTKKDLRYWGQYLLTEEDLIREHIHSVKKLWVNGKSIFTPAASLCFCYEFPDYPEGKKIYYPERKRYKWISNLPTSHIENLYGQQGNLLLTKSRKDRLVLSKILHNVANTQNESTSWCTTENLDYIDKHITDVLINYDSDDPGVAACKRITSTYGYRYINAPRYLLKQGIKDFADWVKAEGSYEPLLRFLKKKKLIHVDMYRS